MSKSVNFRSSLARKYWMALTGLFLITFLIGHLLGNLQLLSEFITDKDPEEARKAFNEYGYFMGHNIFIKILAYITYFSILFHAFFGLYLAVQNKKARPVNYAYNNPGANSSLPSRYMAILGTIVLVFICTHMANFWYKQKVAETVPLHTVERTISMPVGQDPMTGMPINREISVTSVLTTKGDYLETGAQDKESGQKQEILKQEDTKLLDPNSKLVKAEGVRDLYTVVLNFFGHSAQGQPTNELALWAVIGYVLSMLVLAFHLWHGFASAFQSLGLRHKKYTPVIEFVGKAFAVVVPLAFAVIPVIIFMNK